MLNAKERLLRAILSADMESLKSAYVSRVRKERIATDKLVGSLRQDGFVQVEACDVLDKYLTTDGREIIWVRDKAYALTVEEHERRREEALASTTAEKNAGRYTEERAGFLCPKCQDALNCSSVCPACAAGRAGLRYKYSCACGVEFFSKDKI